MTSDLEKKLAAVLPIFNFQFYEKLLSVKFYLISAFKIIKSNQYAKW